jgi:hypothetical protein
MIRVVPALPPREFLRPIGERARSAPLAIDQHKPGCQLRSPSTPKSRARFTALAPRISP